MAGMLQHDFPYTSPGVLPDYGGMMELNRAARRASVMMFVLGPFLILLGGCLIGTTFLFAYMPEAQLEQFRQRIETVTQVPAEVFLRVLGGFVMVVGTLFLVLGIFVRRSGLVSTILSIVLVGLLVLQQIPALLTSLISAGSAAGLGNFVGNLFTFGIFALLFGWLIQAVRAIPKVRAAQSQYAMRYWQMQQNQVMEGGYPTQAQSETPISNQPSS